MCKGNKRGLSSYRCFSDRNSSAILFFVVILFISIICLFPNVTSLTESGSYYEDSVLLDCSSGEDTNLTNSIINHSTVECSEIDTSNVFYSTVRDSGITNMDLNFANVIDNILVSGQIKYGAYTYYGPFRLADIYLGVKPFAIGSLSTNSTAVNNGASVLLTYVTGELGYTVTVDASGIASGQTAVTMRDDGVSPDVVAADGVYTGGVTVDQVGTSTQTLTADVNDNRGNTWQATNDILLDNTFPVINIYVSDTNENKDSADTDSRFVMLYLNYSDNDEVAYCRYGNSAPLLAAAEYEVCSANKPWYLTALNGDKTVHYEVVDIAGNAATDTDSIYLNLTSIPEPTILDDGTYWGYSDRLNARWYAPAGVDDSEATYEVRVYNSSTKNDSTAITGWIYTEDNDIEITGLSLQNGETYYIGLISYSGSVSDEVFTDGITIDTTAPSSLVLNSNVASATWTESSNIVFNFSSSDG
jgi:hypothetical protein